MTMLDEFKMHSEVCARSFEASDSLILDYCYYGEQDPELVAHAVAVEQSIEFPFELVTNPVISENIVPKLVFLDKHSNPSRFSLSFNVEITGFEVTQLLNVLFGNISMLDDVRLVNIHLPKVLCELWNPAFGVSGLRHLCNRSHGPLICGALKPMGLSTKELGYVAQKFVQAGVDCLKDDHGLADQSFCRFKERVKICSHEVLEASAKFGKATLYIPNISGPIDSLLDRAHFAKAQGAGGLMVAPGLIGFDSIRCLRTDKELNLPIFSHPSFLGTFSLNAHQGLAFELVFGVLPRLFGADASIFPNYGGRFRFSVSDCHAIAKKCLDSSLGLKPIFPGPAGGMHVDSVSQICKDYGTEDVMVLIGGDLYRKLPNIERIF